MLANAAEFGGAEIAFKLVYGFSAHRPAGSMPVRLATLRVAESALEPNRLIPFSAGGFRPTKNGQLHSLLLAHSPKTGDTRRHIQCRQGALS
jgi:hypothetical protein